MKMMKTSMLALCALGGAAVSRASDFSNIDFTVDDEKFMNSFMDSHVS
jgi:hypothetical protein